MLESGCVSVKNTVNIMMKNIIDIVLGGLTYWIFGYAFSYGRGTWTNSFVALGDFLIDPSMDDPLMGQIFAAFLFQLSFSTTATTIGKNNFFLLFRNFLLQIFIFCIVSGAMAERCNFKACLLYTSPSPRDRG